MEAQEIAESGAKRGEMMEEFNRSGSIFNGK